MRKSRRHGQSLAEMAMLLPVFIVLIGGAGQVGVIMFGNIAADTAARDAARYAAQYPIGSGAFSCDGGGNCQGQTVAGDAINGCNPLSQTASNIVCRETAVSAGTQGGNSSPVMLNVIGICGTIAGQTNACPATSVATISNSTCKYGGVPDGSNSGLTPPVTTVTVRVSYSAPIFIPFIGNLLSDPGVNTKTVYATVVQRIQPCSMTNGN